MSEGEQRSLHRLYGLRRERRRGRLSLYRGEGSREGSLSNRRPAVSSFPGVVVISELIAVAALGALFTILFLLRRRRRRLIGEADRLGFRDLRGLLVRRMTPRCPACKRIGVFIERGLYRRDRDGKTRRYCLPFCVFCDWEGDRFIEGEEKGRKRG